MPETEKKDLTEDDVKAEAKKAIMTGGATKVALTRQADLKWTIKITTP